MPARTAAALATALLLAASAGAQQQPPAPRPLPTSLQGEHGAIRVERLAGLELPYGMAYLPDGRLLITEKPGRLRIFARGTLGAPVEGVPTVAFRGQGGMLDVAVDPDFARNRLVYLSYTEAAAEQPPGTRETGDPRFGALDTTDNQLKGTAVARARLEGNALRDLQVIWRQLPKTVGRGHFAGRMAFGPDGKLWITSGDRMRFDPAQDSTSSIGKILRINADGSIPGDNPLTGAGASRDVWSMGHRNPLGIAFHPVTDSLWIHEMGPLGGDEINVIVRGRDYGWPSVSNGRNYDGSHIPPQERNRRFAPPRHGWSPVVSPSGMLWYTGARFPQWRGSMLLGGLSSQSLIRMTFREGRPANEERIFVGRRIRDVIQAPDGAVLLLTDGPAADLLRLTPMAGASANARGSSRR